MCNADGELLFELRCPIESLILDIECTLGDKIPAVLVGVFNCDGLAEDRFDEYAVSAGEVMVLSLGAVLVLLCGGEYGGGGTTMPSKLILVLRCSLTWNLTYLPDLQTHCERNVCFLRPTRKDYMAHCTRRVSPWERDHGSCSQVQASAVYIILGRTDSRGTLRRGARSRSGSTGPGPGWLSRWGGSTHCHGEDYLLAMDHRLRGEVEEETAGWHEGHMVLYQALVRGD
jgi:hypothetical protein